MYLHRISSHLFSRGNVLIASAIVALLAQRPASATTNLGNIMPLGDSITDGSGAAGGYRDPLYTDLTNASYSFTYVGSATDNATTLLTNNGQTHHEGHSGYVIESKDPGDTGSGSGRAGILDNINTYLNSSVNPNYILLMIGTNDVDLNYFPGTPAGSEQGNRLSTLISAISNKTTGLKPNAHLIVAQITATETASENTRVQAYNSYVAQVVQAHAALGENVTMVDMYDALNPNSTDMTDNLHPNLSGYNKMAQVWMSGIQAAPEPASVGLFLIAGMGLLARRRKAR